MLRTAVMVAVLQVLSHKSGGGRFTSLDLLDTILLMQLACNHKLLAHAEFSISQNPQVLYFRTTLYTFSAQSVFVLGITQVQGLAPGLVEPKFCAGLLLRPVKYPLNCIPSFQLGEYTTQVSVIHKLTHVNIF